MSLLTKRDAFRFEERGPGPWHPPASSVQDRSRTGDGFEESLKIHDGQLGIDPFDRISDGAAAGGLTIRVSSGSGSGRTPLSAFDGALRDAGVSDFNLVRLSSVIPPGSTVLDVHGRHQIVGGHGDLLYCVYAAAYAYSQEETAWAGIAWALEREGSGAGVFVEHDAHSRRDLEWALSASVEDLSARRGGGYEFAGSVLSPVTSTGIPACAVVIASYRREGW